jgi:hypothetical protein
MFLKLKRIFLKHLINYFNKLALQVLLFSQKSQKKKILK